MGNKPSSLAPPPLKYGVQGELGRLIYVFAIPGSSPFPPSVLALSAAGLDVFNMLTGDRRKRLVAPPLAGFTCAAHSREPLSGVRSAGSALLPLLLAIGTAAGEVHIFHAQSLAPLGSVCTSGQAPPPAAARPRMSSEVGGAGMVPLGGSAVAAPAALQMAGAPSDRTPVTAIAFYSHCALLVGHGDGSLAVVEIDPPVGGAALDGAAPLTIRHSLLLPPPPGCAPPLAVSALAAVGGVGGDGAVPTFPLLAVGHRSGALYLHDVPVAVCDPAYAAAAAGGALLFPTPAGLARLLPMPRLRCLAAFSPGAPSGVSLIDLEKGRLVALDFDAELRSVGRGRSSGGALGALAWDDARSALLGGGADGAVYVRVARRIEGTGDLAVRLLRVAAPAPSANAPAPITSIKFLKDDTILTGDESGIVRRVPHATGLGLVCP